MNEIPVLDDQQGRRLDYLRLSVTDRCNLRCRYCLPETGVGLADRSEMLSWEELFELSRICVEAGVRKIRLTGGEPLLRNGVLDFLDWLGDLPQGPELLVTTNGLLLDGKLERLWQAGVRRLNVSLDSLRADTYRAITRRDDMKRVLDGLAAADEAGFGIKLNTVVMAGVNDRELTDFVALTRDHDWTVRFIEAMPFDGRGGNSADLVDGEAILARIRTDHELQPVIAENRSVAELYQVPGFAGRVGLIRGHSRTFCATCSRLRISAKGQLRTCLYGQPVLDLRRCVRDGLPRPVIVEKIREVILNRFSDGLEAQHAQGGRHGGSMSQIGG